MTAAQHTAFQAGSGVSAAALLTGIAGLVVLLVFVWVIWVTLGTFRAWQDGQVSVLDLTWSALRASIVLLVLGFYLVGARVKSRFIAFTPGSVANQGPSR